MSSSRRQLLELIHVDKRIRMSSAVFREPTAIVKLDFIGAEEYFITDRGYIYSRKIANTTRSGILSRGYLPMTYRDIKYPYPWCKLPTGYGEIWFPIPQLLGWAFDPYPIIEPKAFISSKKINTNSLFTDYTWTSELPETGSFSFFMNALYAD